MRVLAWLFRAFVFFALFAFALNNQQETTVHWFFGFEWRAPMVFIVLAAFVAGCALGVLAMVPAWWRHRRAARRLPVRTVPAAVNAKVTATSSALPSQFGAEAAYPPRDGA
jgi:putative membrane protein